MKHEKRAAQHLIQFQASAMIQFHVGIIVVIALNAFTSTERGRRGLALPCRLRPASSSVLNGQGSNDIPYKSSKVLLVRAHILGVNLIKNLHQYNFC